MEARTPQTAKADYKKQIDELSSVMAGAKALKESLAGLKSYLIGAAGAGQVTWEELNELGIHIGLHKEEDGTATV